METERRKKRKEERRGIVEREEGREENRERRAKDAPPPPPPPPPPPSPPQGAFPSRELGNNITPIKGRLGKNTTPTRRNSERPIQRRQKNRKEDSRISSIHLLQTSSAQYGKQKIFKNVRPRGNRTPIYRESTRRHTQPFQIPHKLALKAVRVFPRTRVHTKRFLSRSVSLREASLNMKRLSPQRVFPHKDVSSHEASLHTKPRAQLLALTSSPFNTDGRAPTFTPTSPPLNRRAHPYYSHC